VTPEICPNCGAEVPPRAKACPECGSDEKTGWSERAHADHLGLPDEEFDYDEYVKREFGPSKPKPQGIAWYWWLVAIGLLLLFALPYILRR
jgi:zinc ribbon protein